MFEIESYRFLQIIDQNPMDKICLFNLACIFHTVELPMIAVLYIEQYLCIDSEDMVAHSFLWSLTSSDLGRAVGIEAYKRLARIDIKAAHKLATLTGTGK
jgi:hypothetical protein